jgi:hypothetical protein
MEGIKLGDLKMMDGTSISTSRSHINEHLFVLVKLGNEFGDIFKCLAVVGLVLEDLNGVTYCTECLQSIGSNL